MASYNPQTVERKWQKKWEKEGTWRVDLTKAKNPYYNLMMFPYPSAEGLHVGNVYAFTGSDIHGRFRRMQGYDVFEPMGFDAFGIHSENFAIKQGTHPKEQTAKNVENFRRQLKSLGALFDWSHEVNTTDPAYYKWTQWLFVQLYKAGLAYKAKAPVDWCPSCKTVLADEQVIQGRCERCGTEVVQKELEQWFLKITKYADKLLKNLEKIDWSERTKTAQRNWIGRSQDVEIDFPIKGSDRILKVVTTRPDTIFGATFMVLAPEHSLVDELKERVQNQREVDKYRKEAAKKSEFERGLAAREKTGIVLEGVWAVNPVTREELPVYLADYVLAGYGTGAIMAVPGHDDRDYAFAKGLGLPVKTVVERPTDPDSFSVFVYDYDDSDAAQVLRGVGKAAEYWTPTQRKYDVGIGEADRVVELLGQHKIGKTAEYAKIREGQSFALESAELDFGVVYAGDGEHVNSGFLNGMDNKKAVAEVTARLSKKKLGRKTVHYHLRDWLISRQRYWGPPIPIVYCENCGTVPVPEDQLPVLLPEVEDFRPKGRGSSPLASVEEFVKTECPECGGAARRETDVSDTFLDSSWYFFRYPSSRVAKEPFDKKLTEKWLPVDTYIGGQEHAVLHLLYTRFVTMALFDMGRIDFEEPFKAFRAHGLITKDGAKMSKSKGNVVNPDDFVSRLGADTVRTYLMFTGPFAQGGDWSDSGVMGVYRFFARVWDAVEKKEVGKGEDDASRHLSIKKVTEDLEHLRYNTAVAALMEYFNGFSQQEKLPAVHINTLLLLLSPFAPHLTAELWERLGNKGQVYEQKWPSYDPEKTVSDTVSLVVQVNGKVRDTLRVSRGISDKQAEQAALESTAVQKHLRGKKPKRVVVVSGKLVNVVV